MGHAQKAKPLGLKKVKEPAPRCIPALKEWVTWVNLGVLGG